MVPVREIGVAVCGAATLLALVGFSSGASARNESEAVTMLGAPLTLVQSTAALSPPHFGFSATASCMRPGSKKTECRGR